MERGVALLGQVQWEQKQEISEVWGETHGKKSESCSVRGAGADM